MLDPLRVVVVAVWRIGPVRQVIGDLPISIRYSRPAILSGENVTKKLLRYVLITENDQPVMLILGHSVLLGHDVQILFEETEHVLHI